MQSAETTRLSGPCTDFGTAAVTSSMKTWPFSRTSHGEAAMTM